MQISNFAQNIPDLADLAPINADGSEILEVVGGQRKELQRRKCRIEKGRKRSNKKTKTTMLHATRKRDITCENLHANTFEQAEQEYTNETANLPRF